MMFPHQERPGPRHSLYIRGMLSRNQAKRENTQPDKLKIIPSVGGAGRGEGGALLPCIFDPGVMLLLDPADFLSTELV